MISPENQPEQQPQNATHSQAVGAQTPKSPNHTNKIVFIVAGVVVALVLILGVVGYFVIQAVSKPTLTKEQQAIVDLAKDIGVYPDAYIAAGLPQYPGSEVVSLSEKDDTPRDIVSLSVDTSDSPEKIAQFYNDKLLGLGWVKNDSKVKLAGATNLEYSKGNQNFDLIVQPSVQDKTKNTILITWSEIE